MTRSALSSWFLPVARRVLLTPRRPGREALFLIPRKGLLLTCATADQGSHVLILGWNPSGSTSHLFDPARGTMISYPNSLPAEGGRGLFTRSGIDSTPRGTSGPPCMRTGLEHLPVVESANPHPPQPHRQLARRPKIHPL